MTSPRVSIFDRLIGLETEYAPRFSSFSSDTAPPSSLALFESLVHALGERLPLVVVRQFKEGRFLATGGAVWFESRDGMRGLVEGATPECRTPRQLLAWQRGQDRLLGEAARASRSDGEFTLLKNDRDSRGHFYGAQENYEADVARGVWLWVWRAGLAGMFPLIVVYWATALLFLGALYAYVLLAGVAYLLVLGIADLVRRFAVRAPDSPPLAGSLRNLNPEGAMWLFPRWLDAALIGAEMLMLAPLAGVMYVWVSLLAFRRLRRSLLPFLISRAAVCGAGMLDDDGRFHLADKARGINCLIGFGGFRGDRPLFSFGHFLKAIYGEGLLSLRGYFGLFSRRQRLQIALGDSNLCERAEYLRIGATLLVIDAAEAGALQPPGSVHRPIRTLHALSADPSLEYELRLSGPQQATALDVQRFYLNACRRFLQSQSESPQEAWELLFLWEDTLERLEDAPQSLVGSLDWVTKRFLLDEAGAESDWEARKKIDLRYHELSPQGYFQQLCDAGHVERLLDEAEVERATRVPPPDSPAATRGRYIREFAGGLLPVRASWKLIEIGRGRRARRIKLRDHRRLREPDDAPPLEREVEE